MYIAMKFHFSGNKVNPHAPFLFISIAPFLINEESAECKKALANTLSALFNVLPEATIETLKKSTMTWFRGKNIAHSQLACRILVIFIDTLGIQPLQNIGKKKFLIKGTVDVI